MYLLYNTTLNASLQLMQLRPSRNTENPVDAAMAEEELGLKTSTRSLAKVTEDLKYFLSLRDFHGMMLSYKSYLS